ncbi:MAG: hypothetical protein ACP5U2_11765 [Bryobacteraceae bacterium]
MLLSAARAGEGPASAAQAAQGGLGALPRAEACFDVESLPADSREAAEELFLKMLDSEGLYTLAGGIKPASSGFVRFVVDAEATTLDEVDKARRLLEHFRCMDHVFATVHHFRRISWHPKTGRPERHYEGIVIAVEPFRRLVRRYEGEFARLGVSPHSHPMEVLMAIEHADQVPRWRGYGRIFGFPQEAVDFFVRAGEQQEKGGPFVRRRFVSLPTYARAERGVVYAVAEDVPETEEDERLRKAAEAALAEYRERRGRYVGAGKPGVARLLRDWFCPDGGACRLPPAPAVQARSDSKNDWRPPNRRQTVSATR